MEGISICRGKDVTTEEEIDRGGRVGNEEPLGGGVCSGSQSLVCSEERGQVVHPGVATLDGRVLGEEEQEVKVTVDVKNGELIVFGERCCKWKRTEGRRWRGGVSYSLLEWTLHVSTPTQLSRGLLWPNTLSIRSDTCMLTGNHGGIRSSQSHTPLLLLLNWVAELGSSNRGPCFLCTALEGKHEMCGEFSMFSGDRVGA